MYLVSTATPEGRVIYTRYILNRCFVSTVAKQMMSNMEVATCDIMQMCFFGFSIQIE